MRSLVYAVACGALLAATSANAAVKLSFSGASGSSISWLNPYEQTANFPGDGMVVNATQLPPKKNGTVQTVNYGASTTADVGINKKAATFTSGVAARGPSGTGDAWGASATSTTGVDAIITNTGHKAVGLNSIDSSIIQAGMGFMVQKTTGAAADNNVFTGYGVDSKGSFGDLNVGGSLNGRTIATSSFSFNIYGADYAETTDVEPLYTLSGWVSLGFDEAGNVVENSDVSDAQGVLNGFQSIYTDPLGLKNSDNVAGFQWDETPISVALNTVLGANQSTELFYRATSSVEISAPCVSAKECLVAYSGFGDPVGRGGGVSAFALLNNSSNASNCPDNDSRICFDPQKIHPFTDVSFDRGVPEPASWALMIMGFGLAGAALRRRGVPSYS